MNASWFGLAYFFVMAALAVFGALATVISQNPIRGAMGLLVMILAVAGLFLALHAEFLAAVQFIVYAGAIVILFLFVIMLLGPSAVSPRDHRGQIWRAIGGAVFGLFSAGAIYLCYRGYNIGTGTTFINGSRSPELPMVPAGFGGVDAIGKALFDSHIVPFELSSALLMVAVIGAVAVARGKHISHGEEGAADPNAKPPTKIVIMEHS